MWVEILAFVEGGVAVHDGVAGADVVAGKASGTVFAPVGTSAGTPIPILLVGDGI